MSRIIIAIVVGLALGGTARAENRFVNPGFEDGTTGWENFWGQTGSVSTQRSHSGQSSAQIAHPESKESGWAQTEVKGLEAGGVYKVEAYAYRDNDTISAKVWLLTGWWPTGAPRFRSTNGRSLLGVNTWDLLTGEITANPDGVIRLNLYVNGQGNVWFDDVSLTLLKTREKRKAELLAITTAATATPEENAQAHLDLGQIALWIEQDPAAALRHYQATLALAPADKLKCITAHANLAEIYRRQKDLTNALASCYQLLELDPDGAIGANGQTYVGRPEIIKSIYGIADTFSQNGDLNSALATYTRLLEFASKDKAESLKLLQFMAAIHRQRGDQAHAASVAKQIADLNNLLANPGFEDGTTGWENFWGQTGSVSTERSHSGTNSAKIAHPGNAQSGWSQHDIKGLLPGALYRVEVYAWRDTNTVSAHVWLLSGWWHAGAPLFRSTGGTPTREVNAWELLTGELAANPDGSIRLNLPVNGTGNVWFDDASLTLVQTKDERKAELLAVITSTTAKAEEKAQAHLDLGQIAWWADQDLPAALENYRNALALDPADKVKCLTAHANLAEIYRRQQDLTNALASCHQLLELDPDGAAGANGQLYVGRKGVLSAMAEIHLQQKDYANALTSYQRLLELVPKGGAESRKVLYNLHDIYRQQGDLDGAGAILKRIADEYSPPAVPARETPSTGLRPAGAPPGPSPAVKRQRKGWSSQLVLADDGRPHCSVVVDQESPPKVVAAARFLRDTISQMAGCEIPIFDVRENPTGARLVVGSNPLADRLGVRVAQTYPEGERYRIRRVGNDVVLLGNDARSFDGTSMAVLDFLQRLGCGWFAPDPLWQVVPKLDPVILPAKLEVDEQPDFLFRLIYLGKLDPEQERILRGAWRLGGREMWIGHCLSDLVPDPLRKIHPDWFGPEQPCLTHPDVHRHIVSQFRERLDTSPGQFLFFSLSANDTVGFCQCPRCQAAGNVSAQSMIFANGIAEALRETHPGRFQVGFIAYWVTATPPRPMIKGKPEVVVMLTDNHELTKPRESDHWTDWLETGALTGVYEWWIPACNHPEWQRVPWYSGESALRNLRYWRERGIRYVSYETGTGELDFLQSDAFPTIRWPLYYVGARGAWDSALSADDIMREACGKLYGQAAEPMLQFYRTLETAMLETPYPGSLWGLPGPERVYTPAIQDRATGYLERAAAMTDDPAARARIAQESNMWTQARQVLAERNAQRGRVKTVLVGKPRWRNVPVVKTYHELPYRHELIGLVEVALDPGRTDQPARDKAVEDLKRECVQLGANGLLLTAGGEKTPTIAGKAIYVIEE